MRTAFLFLILTGVTAGFSAIAQEPRAIGPATQPATASTPAVELTIETSKPAFKSSEGVSFTVVFHNTGTQNLLLNGGELLGNGAQIWSSLEAELKSENGQRIPMTLGWRIPGVAGRIYFLGFPLRPGASYKLPVTADDYLIGRADRFKPGKYEIRLVYRGRQSAFRDSTQMPACWEGEVQSNTLRVEVLAE